MFGQFKFKAAYKNCNKSDFSGKYTYFYSIEDKTILF